MISALALLGLMTTGCGRHGAIDAKAPIIIISIDTLRSDHLPAYGYTRVRTRAIDHFRKDAILFERAYSHSPLTLVSHASIFTGLLPAEHGIRDNQGYILNPKARTLAELLKSKGYATGGAVSSVVLRSDSGVKRGFDFWEDGIDLDPGFLSIGRAQRSGEATREIAQKWIGEHVHEPRPFVFFFHIYEPHTPYEPVEPFRSRYGSTYDGEIAAADAVVGKFLDYLRREDIYGRATILLLSDHGEGLGDHGEDEHGILLYRETLQVPLMLKLPHAAQKGTSVSTPVQLIDIFPTIANAFGEQQTGGRSLLDAAHGAVKNGRSFYAETYYPRLHFGWSDLHSLITGVHHYIDGAEPELYDVTADPAEKKNVALEDRRVYAAMREQIRPYIKAPAAPVEASEEQKRQLIALGYTGSNVNTTADAVLPDPRKNIGKVKEISRAFGFFKDARYEESVQAARHLLHDNAGMQDIWALQARALARLNRREEAIGAAREGLRASPCSATLAMVAANLSLELDRLDDAEAYARLALKQTPRGAHEVLARVSLRRKNFEKARDEANAALVDDTDRPETLVLLGHIAIEEGKLDDALRYIDQATALLQSTHRRPLPLLSFLRGDTLARMGRVTEAEDAFLTEIRLFPTETQAYKSLILLYARKGETQELMNIAFSLEKAAPAVSSYVAISETLRTAGDASGSYLWVQRGLARFPGDRRLKALARG